MFIKITWIIHNLWFFRMSKKHNSKNLWHNLSKCRLVPSIFFIFNGTIHLQLHGITNYQIKPMLTKNSVDIYIMKWYLVQTLLTLTLYFYGSLICIAAWHIIQSRDIPLFATGGFFFSTADTRQYHNGFMFSLWQECGIWYYSKDYKSTVCWTCLLNSLFIQHYWKYQFFEEIPEEGITIVVSCSKVQGKLLTIKSCQNDWYILNEWPLISAQGAFNLSLQGLQSQNKRWMEHMNPTFNQVCIRHE